MPFASAMTRTRLGAGATTTALPSDEKTHKPAPLSASGLPPPPPPSTGTPTRSLLQRIQRRSSTNAEVVVKSDAHARRVYLSQTLQQAPPVSSMRPTSSEHVRLQRRGSVSDSSGSGSSTLPGRVRHTRTSSSVTLSASKVMPARQTYTPQTAVQVNEMGKLVAPLFVRKASTASTASSATKKEKQSTTTNDVTLSNRKEPLLPSQFVSLPLTKHANGAAELSTLQRGRRMSAFVDRSSVLRQVGSDGQGLTREAALALEQEFGEQERILQGLQRDNERKTIEVEELRRQKSRLEEFCARYFGQDHWREVVFGFTAPSSPDVDKSATLSSDLRRHDGAFTDDSVRDNDDAAEFATPLSPSHAVVEDLLRTLYLPPSTPVSPTMERQQALEMKMENKFQSGTAEQKPISSLIFSSPRLPHPQTKRVSLKPPPLANGAPRCSSPLRATEDLLHDEREITGLSEETSFTSALMEPSARSSATTDDCELVQIQRSTLKAVLAAHKQLLADLEV